MPRPPPTQTFPSWDQNTLCRALQLGITHSPRKDNHPWQNVIVTRPTSWLAG